MADTRHVTTAPAIGVGTPLGYGIAAPELVAYARAADDAGLDDISIGELRSTEVFGLASAMIAASTHLRVETSIVAVVTRAPGLIAMGAATLAQLSGGRFVLGLGAGSPIVAGWHGTELSSPLRRVEETVRLVRSATAGERLEEWGSFRIAPEMVGDVRIVLSAMNEKMVRLAGRVADGMILQFCGPGQAAHWGAVARAERAAAGIEGRFEVMVNLWAAAGDDRTRGLYTFRREVGPYLAVSTYRNAAVALSSAAEVDVAGERWRAGGREAAAEAVPPGISDTLLCVLGADDVSARVHAYAAAGVDRVRFVPLTPVPGDVAAAMAVVEELGAIRSTLHDTTTAATTAATAAGRR